MLEKPRLGQLRLPRENTYQLDGVLLNHRRIQEKAMQVFKELKNVASQAHAQECITILDPGGN